ncbi:MAG: hypothetical protein NVSMB46_00170 [Candidatus Saccharimonadales bacterium]
MDNERYLYGLPIPNEFEGDMLSIKNGPRTIDEQENDSISYIFNQILCCCPELKSLIMSDMHESASRYQFLSEDEQTEFYVGIWDGYGFLIGNVEFLYFLRSPDSNIQQYMENGITELGTVPMLTKNEQARIQLVRNGKALLGLQEKLVKSSAELAAIDAKDYLFEAVRFDHVFEEELRQTLTLLSQGSSDKEKMSSEVEAYDQGFTHGFEQAIEMYIQMETERTGRKIKALKLSFPE